MIKRVAIIVGLALVAFLGYEIYQAGFDERAKPPINDQIVFHNGTATGRRIAMRSWTADYERIVSNADQTILQLDNVHHGTIFRKGRPYLKVRAAHMEVNTITKDFTVTGPMEVETVGPKERRTFATDSAVWNDAAQRLTLANRITIRHAADQPLIVGSVTVDVRTGDVELRGVAGPAH